jgi:hypothetical protein
MAEEREEPMAESEDTPDVEGHTVERATERATEHVDTVDAVDAPDFEAHIAERITEHTEHTE